MKNPKSRREFLFSSFSNNTKSISELASSSPDDDAKKEKIKLLSPDGKLVEVNSQILDQCKRTSKARNKEILKWISDAKDSSSDHQAKPIK